MERGGGAPAPLFFKGGGRERHVLKTSTPTFSYSVNMSAARARMVGGEVGGVAQRGRAGARTPPCLVARTLTVAARVHAAVCKALADDGMPGAAKFLVEAA